MYGMVSKLVSAYAAAKSPFRSWLLVHFALVEHTDYLQSLALALTCIACLQDVPAWQSNCACSSCVGSDHHIAHQLAAAAVAAADAAAAAAAAVSRAITQLRNNSAAAAAAVAAAAVSHATTQFRYNTAAGNFLVNITFCSTGRNCCSRCLPQTPSSCSLSCHCHLI